MSIDMYSISQYLAQLLDISSFDDMVPNGLQVEGARPIRKIACAVTASLYAIDEACRQNADILLVHHGLFFKQGFAPIQGIVKHRLDHLMRSGIHLLAYHLPLDSHKELGNAWPQALKFGLKDLAPFGMYNGKMIGVQGMLATPMSGKSFYAQLQTFWGAKGIYEGVDDTKEVRTCAFVSGQGHRFLKEALDQRIDCFVNGTIDESSWYAIKESGIQFMAFGHYATEKYGVQALGQHVAQRFGLEYFFIEEANPW